jgi:hypothetical protein
MEKIATASPRKTAGLMPIRPPPYTIAVQITDWAG